ncbi:MAG: polyprenyl synthetase family protein [Oscillospiraceae bacterium]|nr:polyprenyl synthetase family protein [Oscillospiraceae bacterium]
MSKDYQELYRTYKAQIETYLEKDCFIYPEEPQQELFESMRYSLLAGGKRLRPIFVFDFCNMCGANWLDATAFAAALEMIHTYSLIHDDLPCMDNDDYRRGMLTNHKKFGEATAVLAGDALLTAAFTYVAKAPFSAEIRIKAVEVLANCAGELGMVGGQVLDMDSESRQCTKEEVLAIQSRKTGALIKAACLLGVLAGNGNDCQISAAETFAENLGLAFQIRDDMLDVIGNAEELGKAVGVDTVKNTFVHLYGLETCDRLVKEHTQTAILALNAFSNHDFMRSLALELTERTK